MITKYKTHGVCAKNITIEVDDDDRLVNAEFEGGCNGNLKGITSLCKGMKTDDIIDKLSGLKCGYKNTSCPDQLAAALKEYKASK